MMLFQKVPQAAPLDQSLQKVLELANTSIVDKSEEIHLCLVSLLSGGHVLLEGAPGLGKTSLVKSLAKLLGLDSKRIQFTNDILPADIVGTSVFDSANSKFEFHKGPLFSHFILADEINRATPKTQSALLEAMEEAAVSVDGKTYDLPNPFFVFATQNPADNVGTFSLPESQLDRFLMKISISSPNRNAEKELLLGENRKDLIANLPSCFEPGEFLRLMAKVDEVSASEHIVEYLLDLVEKSRNLSSGLSTRAAQDFLKAAKASAMLNSRSFVIPEDLQRIGVAVMNHRIGNNKTGLHKTGVELAKEILSSVTVA